jgi:putative transposase
MPTHFHAVVEPELEGALSAFCNRVEGGYARYVRRSSGTVGVGHVFQDRFWNRGIEDSLHFLNVLRYVESNPLQAQLVSRAADWPWSSLTLRQTWNELIDLPRFALPQDWEAIVESPMTVREMLEVRYEEQLLRNRRTKITRNVNSKSNAR